MIRYKFTIHKEEEGEGFYGEFEDLPGCFTQGDTVSEILEYARDALSLYLEEANDPKYKLPKPTHKPGDKYLVEPYLNVSIPLMIKAARISKGFSQNQAARLLNMKLQTYQKLEYIGKSNPTARTLKKIATAFNTPFEITP